MSKKISELPQYSGAPQPIGDVPISINGVTYKIAPDKLVALIAGVTNTSQLTNDGPDGTHPYLTLQTLPNTSEVRVPVNDANYTITGTDYQLIAYTVLNADRTVTLPPATSANQRIRIIDESSTCSSARRIIIAPNGADTISGGISTVINFPGGSVYFESNGAGKWTTLSTTAIQLSAGVTTSPSITDNANGTVTVGSGVYNLFANIDGSGRPKSHVIPGGTFTMVDGVLNYIIAKYDSGSSTSSLVTSVLESDINSFSSVGAFVIFRQGTVLFISDYDKLGLALSNKLQRNAEQTNNIRVKNGTLLLSESATRIVNVSAGTAWLGAIEKPLAAVSSSTANTMFFVFQTAPGVWNTTTFASGGQYSNTQYNDPTTGLQTLSGGRYGVIFVFRSLGQGNKLAYVLGQGDYTLGQAQTATRPNNLPLVITSQMLPVGRIIVLKGASTATQIDKITDESYAFAGVTDHEALSNLMGGDITGHLHVTQAEKDAWNFATGNVQAGTSYTVVASDNGKQLIFTNSAAVTVTIPSGLPTGFNCEFYQQGTGQVSFATSGTTLRYSTFEVPAITEQYSLVGIENVTNVANTYKLYGQLQSI